MKFNKEVLASILIRTDGSSLLGIGHIMRCLALAQALEKEKIETIFMIKDYGSNFKKLIQNYGYKVELIPAKSTFIQEVALTISLAQKYGVNLILTDLSNTDVLADLKSYSQYIKALKKADKVLVSIDGFGAECIASKLRLPFDAIIVPYYRAEKQSYKVDKKTKLFLGTDYFILRQEFIRKAQGKRKIKKRSKNILLGKNLNKIKLQGLNYKIASNLKDKELIKLMQWADLALLNSGLTRYEAAALGLPCLIIARNKIHDRIMKQYVKSQACLYLGEENKLKQDDIIREIKKVLGDYGLRKKMSLYSKKLVDGRGGERITKGIIQLMKGIKHGI